ncbi:diguanylate phosphodiesterase [Lonsdalea iberica]|uniref:Diguanylate phosphodiesterase n=1 Tax=Lonsdalea iberica TaxID=1082703 RepID=A0ABX3XED0_9GAMM|nr:EAL domain-containing protein [Lonsdalea iberica]OSN09912.1 diguanylate phosphodiesterase [Lonsdalea iberica]
MYSFVARQPILDQHLQPVAYELLFRQGITNKFPDVSPEYATAQLIAEQFLTTPLNKLTNDHPSYINFPYQLLIDGQAEILPADKVVIEILENSTPDEELFAAVKRLKRKGFTLALDDFSMDPIWDRFLPYVDIIKFDLQQSTFEEIGRYISTLRHKHLSYLAEKVETNEQFLRVKAMGFTLFQGYFFSHPQMFKAKRLSNDHKNAIQLLKEANERELNYDRIERLINSDLSLAYKLMRYFNNFRYKANLSVITTSMSFRSIAIFLGQRELRRFISLISITMGSKDKSCELYRMSLIRGKFCELLSIRLHGREDPFEAFLCGLFSMLDAILDSPMDLLLEQIPVSSHIKRALMDNAGELACYLSLISYYEKQNWEQVNTYMEMMEVNEDQMLKLITEATLWADELLDL